VTRKPRGAAARGRSAMGRTWSREPSTRSSCWWHARLGSGRRFAPQEGRRPADRAGGRGAEVDAVQQLLGAGRNGRARLMGELADQAEVLAADHVLIDCGALPGQADSGPHVLRSPALFFFFSKNWYGIRWASRGTEERHS
jgi:hypothetical protein